MVVIFRLFVTQLFMGPLVVQSMLLNRRTDDGEMKVSKTGGHSMPDTCTIATTAAGETIYPEDKKNEGVIPIIYACATMWHENKQVCFLGFLLTMNNICRVTKKWM